MADQSPSVSTAPPQTDEVEYRPFLESKSLWSSIKEGFRERFHPEELPPLELQSKPVPVKELWSRDTQRSVRTRVVSFLAHVLVIALLLLPIFHRPTRERIVRAFSNVPLVAPSVYVNETSGKKIGGGGGGGARELKPPSRGKLPKLELSPMAPPRVVVKIQPKLPVAPSVAVDPHVQLPQPNLPMFGAPTAAAAPPSEGTGSGAGIGTGKGGGVGEGNGAGVGPGKGGNYGGDTASFGAGITPPEPIFSPDPEYSDEARKAKYEGTVILWAVIGADGRVHEVRVSRPVGLGLDQKAVEAVEKWRFIPAKKNGVPIAVTSEVEVNFRLY